MLCLQLFFSSLQNHEPYDLVLQSHIITPRLDMINAQDDAADHATFK